MSNGHQFKSRVLYFQSSSLLGKQKQKAHVLGARAATWDGVPGSCIWPKPVPGIVVTWEKKSTAKW